MTLERTESPPQLLRLLRKLIIGLTNLYAVGLVIYLLLRVTLGDSQWWMAFINNFAPLYFLPLALLLPLMALLRVPWAFARLLPLLLIAALWFGPRFLPRSAAAADGPTLKVITFNMWANNRQVDDIREWMTAQAPDLLLVQEAVDNPCCPMPEMPDGYMLFTGDDLAQQAFGVVAFSRLPVLAQEAFTLNGKQQLRLEVEFAGQRIAVYNIHLFMPAGPPRLNAPYVSQLTIYDDSHRNQQIAALLERLQNEPLPYVVAGDFNMSDMAEPYHDLAAFMGDAYRETTPGFGMTWPVPEAGSGIRRVVPPIVRIDYVWHSGDFQAVDSYRGPYLGSDHLPVVASLALVE